MSRQCVLVWKEFACEEGKKQKQETEKVQKQKKRIGSFSIEKKKIEEKYTTKKNQKNNKTKNKLELEPEHLIFLVRDWKGRKGMKNTDE